MTGKIKSQLENIAYLAGLADSVEGRRKLDEILRTTQTKVDEAEPGRWCLRVRQSTVHESVDTD